jgi:SAM-dependent methyltransferase
MCGELERKRGNINVRRVGIMDRLELYNISEQFMELINPLSPEKIITIGKYLGLKEGSNVIDFGCGFGEVLVLWAESFGIKGIGIDIREHACERAKKKIKDRGLSDRFEIICGKGAEYSYEKGTFDVAACIGASFIWGGFRPTIRGMKDAIHSKGKLVIGEPYWIKEPVPVEYGKKNENESINSEIELLKIAREEGYDFKYMVRSSHDDWDCYEASNWYSLARWLEENPDHPEKKEVVQWLHEMQDEYIQYGREYCGFAVYILNPIKY